MNTIVWCHLDSALTICSNHGKIPIARLHSDSNMVLGKTLANNILHISMRRKMQWELFLLKSTIGTTIAAIEVKNEMYCLQKRSSHYQKMIQETFLCSLFTESLFQRSDMKCCVNRTLM